MNGVLTMLPPYLVAEFAAAVGYKMAHLNAL